MKKRLLSLCMFALVGLASMAQSWTKPELKLTVDQVPSSAYIYNVEQQQFLTKGGAWGTHAAIKPAVKDAFLYEIQDQGDGVYKLHCSKAANTGYLGRSTETDIYTDTKSGAAWGTTWSFVKNEETGYYRIITAASDSYYGANRYTEEDPVNVNPGLYQMGWNEAGEDLTNGNGAPMGTNQGVYMQDPADPTGWSFDWAFVLEEDFPVYSAQISLYNKLVEAVETGYTESELAEHAALLTSTDVEAINTATAAVTQLILNYGYNHATPENPFDVSEAIKNPTFEGARDAEPEGWIDEFSNMKIQNNKDYHLWDDEGGFESEEYGFQNFSQNWAKGTSITESNIYQVISDLPQGTYILQADAIATAVNAETPVSGCQLYAESGAARYATDIDRNGWTDPGSALPHRYQLQLVHMGGDLKIGYGFTPGSVMWFGIDNVKLFYAGPVDNPGLVALLSAIGAATPYVDEHNDTYIYSNALKEELEQELTTANEIASAGVSEDCLAESGKLNDMMKTIKAEIAAYGNLEKFVKKVDADYAKYPFIEGLGDMYDEYMGAFEDLTASTEQINGWINGYDEFIINGIKAALPTATAENPIEVTPLFENLGFEQNTAESKTPANWTSTSGEFKARANVGEVWNEGFDAYTILSDLPAGSYKLQAHCLSRSGASDANYVAEGAGVTAEFYANGVTAAVPSQHIGAGAEKVYTNDVNLTGDETNPLWAPNSMEGARAYFNMAETPYTSEVTTYVINDNDPLRIGFRDLGNEEGTVLANSWTIWSDVRVFYCGKSVNALYEQVVAMGQQATKALDDPTIRVTAALEMLAEASQTCTDITMTSSEADMQAAIKAVEDALAYVEEGRGMIEKVFEVYTECSELVDEVPSSEEALNNIVAAMKSAIESETFESNEVMQGWFDDLPAARTKHVFTAIVTDEGLTPTEEEPADVTAILANPSFSDNTANGWTVTNTGGSLGGKAPQSTTSTAYEAWNCTAFDINQTVVGLPAGFYKLSVKALYRNGGNSDALAATFFENEEAVRSKAKFYANADSINVISIYDNALTEDPSIDGQATYLYNEQTYYVPNTMISFEIFAVENDLYSNEIVLELNGNTDLKLGLCYQTADANAWFPFDEFKLLYMGTTAPTAVEGVTATTMAPKAIYDLAGRKVSKAVKGIYIINGKKVVK